MGRDAAEHWSDGAPKNAQDIATIYSGDSRIVGYTVDEQSLYMLVNYQNFSRLRLDMCPIDRCDSERTTLFDRAGEPNSPPPLTRLVLAQGTLYFTDSNQAPNKDLLSCPTTGCPDEPKREEAGLIYDIAADEDSVYVLSDEPESMTVWRRPLQGDDALQPVSTISYGLYQQLVSMQAWKGELYMLGRNSIWRLPRDGSASVSLVSNQIRLTAMSVGDAGICFSNGVLTGGVYCCPLDGCREPLSSLPGTQRWPTGVLGDGSDLFWRTSGDWVDMWGIQHFSLSRCALPDCTQVTQMTDSLFAPGLDAEDQVPWVMAHNSTSLFWLDYKIGGSHARIRRMFR